MKDSSIIIGMASVAVIIGVVVFVTGSGAPRAPVLIHADTTVVSVPAVTKTAVREPVLFTELSRGTQSAVTTRVNYLITSESELNKLWSMIKASGKPPAVDFKKQAVVAVFSGLDSKSSSTIAIAKIEDNSVRTVSVGIGFCAKSDVANYEIVLMPTTALPLAHQDQVSKANCPS